MEKTLMSAGCAGHARHVVAFTPRFRGGAVSIDGSTLAGDSARTGILMV
jgi:hypothetical protein